MRLRPALLCLALTLSWAAPAAAQARRPAPFVPKDDNPESRTDAASAKRGTGRAGDDKPAEEKPGPILDTSEVHVRAESQGGDAAHYEFRGFVDLVAGELRIQSDTMDLYTTDKPDGTKARRVVADGNVVFMKDEERLSGAHLDMDLDTGKGTMNDAIGYMEPGVFVEGKKIERRGEKLYHVDGAKFTSCAQPNPRWTFSASSATIEVDKKIIAHDALFKIKSVPAFYAPILYNFGEGFFGAMSRSTDMTFYGDYYSKYGYGFGHEFRYALSPQSLGTFRTYLFWPQQGDRSYDIDWHAAQSFPGGVRASLLARKYSSLSFSQRFNDSFNSASSRSTRGSLNIQKNFGSTTAQLLADTFDTYFGEKSFRVNRRLPSLQIRQSPRKLGKTGLVLDYEARGERLTLGDQDLVQSYSRVDAAPQLSFPLQLTFLQLNPRLAYRYTRWSATALGDGTFVGPALGRQLAEGSLEMRGPSFSRVFDVSMGGYTKRIKHVIGPEVNFLYRSRVDDFLAIPKFDGEDYLVGSNQVTYSLSQRLLAKRPSPSGKLVPYEFFTWRLYQTYYVKIAENQNSFDPNYSSSAFGPTGRPDHNSPIASRVRFRPTPAFSLDANLEYDVNYKQLRTQTYAVRAGTERYALQGSWSHSNRLSLDVEKRVPVRNTVRGAGRIVILKDQLTLEGSTDYDFVRKQLLQNHLKAEWNVQCCGFGVEFIQYNFNARVERQWRFSVHLANIGDTANFLGNDDRGGRPGGASSLR